jgi:hypothetical protein
MRNIEQVQQKRRSMWGANYDDKDPGAITRDE